MQEILHAGVILLCLVVVTISWMCTHDQAQSADEKIVVEFWAMGPVAELVRESSLEFEREHPEIEIRVQRISWSQAHEKILTAFVGETLPDVLQFGNTWIPEFSELQIIDDLGERVAMSQSISPGHYFAGIWSTNMDSSSVYGIPWYVDTRLLFYRKDILQEAGFMHPPKTWAEWETMLERVKEYVGEGNYSILLPVDDHGVPIILGLQQLENMLDEEKRKGNFSGTGFRRAFTFYIQMYRNGWTPVVRKAQVTNVAQEMMRGYFVFYISGPWNISIFKERIPSDMQHLWDTAPMPGPDHGIGHSIAGGASLGITRDSDKKEEAWKFIEYLSRPEVQIQFYEALGNLPSVKVAWEAPGLKKDPYIDAFRMQLEHMRAVPRVPEWEQISAIFEYYAESVVHERMTIDEALYALDEDVDELLMRRQ